MNPAFIICFIIIVVVTVFAFIGGWTSGDLAEGGLWAAFALVVATAVFLVIWGIMAWLVSPYQHDLCEERADGYGLDRSEWSFRQNCRVYLPDGQLVPENRIRITSDGRITVMDD